MLKKRKYISTCNTDLAGGFKLQMSGTNSDEHFLTLYQSISSKPNTESCPKYRKLFVINKINVYDGLLDPANSLMIIIGTNCKN